MGLVPSVDYSGRYFWWFSYGDRRRGVGCRGCAVYRYSHLPRAQPHAPQSRHHGRWRPNRRRYADGVYQCIVGLVLDRDWRATADGCDRC